MQEMTTTQSKGLFPSYTNLEAKRVGLAFCGLVAPVILRREDSVGVAYNASFLGSTTTKYLHHLRTLLRLLLCGIHL